MSPGGLLSTGTGATLLTDGEDADDGEDDVAVGPGVDVLEAGEPPAVVLVFPPHAATPAAIKSRVSAGRDRRISGAGFERVMGQACEVDDETTMRAALASPWP
jgi:hypothetical protein